MCEGYRVQNLSSKINRQSWPKCNTVPSPLCKESTFKLHNTVLSASNNLLWETLPILDESVTKKQNFFLKSKRLLPLNSLSECPYFTVMCVWLQSGYLVYSVWMYKTRRTTIRGQDFLTNVSGSAHSVVEVVGVKFHSSGVLVTQSSIVLGCRNPDPQTSCCPWCTRVAAALNTTNFNQWKGVECFHPLLVV